MSNDRNRLAEIRLIVAHVNPADMADDVDLLTTFAADWRDIGRALDRVHRQRSLDTW